MEVYLLILIIFVIVLFSERTAMKKQRGGSGRDKAVGVLIVLLILGIVGGLVWHFTRDNSSPTPTPTSASTQKYGKIQTVLQVISPTPPVTPIPPVSPVSPVGPSSTINDGTCQCAHGTGSRNCFSLPGEPGQYAKETCTGKTDETTCESVLSSGGKKRCKWVPNN